MNLTFITGNANKAAYIGHVLGQLVAHQKVDLDEIQSLDSRVIVEHKARQAYGIIKTPVLVEDISLEFHAFGRLPGPFIKWFLDEIGNERLCRMLSDSHDRAATARVCYGLFDGNKLHFFENSMGGHIAEAPHGSNGFGWDQIFIKSGMQETRAELDEATEKATSMRKAPLAELRHFLQTRAQSN